MDIKIIEVRKNKLLSIEANNTSSFSANINIDFIPDEVIIRSALYTPVTADLEGFSIYTDMVADYIGSVVQNVNMKQDIRFTLKKPISSQYTFKFFQGDGVTPKLLTDGYLFIHLDFIKYREVKEQKIL